MRRHLYLSPLVLTELSIKLYREGWEDLAIQQYLQAFRFRVVSYTERPAYLVARLVAMENIPFREHARDLMIGAQYLQERCVIITENVKHFAWATLENGTVKDVLGVSEGAGDKEQYQVVYTPAQFLAEIKQISE